MKQKLSYLFAGICCAALIFTFVLLPTVSHSQEETPNYEFIQYKNEACGSTCKKAIKCEGDCDESEGEECCEAGNKEGSSCQHC